MARLLYSFYGDDFTGSTDVLEQLALAGVRAALFLQVPSAEALRGMPGLQAVGVAGESRSRSPGWMSRELPAVLRGLKELGAPVLHYKVCSTFDSSPEYGSIGRAMEIGLEVVGSRFVPVVVGAPHLRRYVWQGMLFAADGAGDVQRIDRHPMSRHPVTPMREPNLMKHLAKQTSIRVGEARAGVVEQVRSGVEAEIEQGCRAVVLDTVTVEDLQSVGAVLWDESQTGQMFAVGSSGLTAALVDAWRREGLIAEQVENATAEQARGPLLVVSGSCSPVTERQVVWALGHGFAGVEARPERLMKPGFPAEVVERAVKSLESGASVVIYTSLGAAANAVQGDAVGSALGTLLRDVLERTGLRRVLLCGGDTSSHAVQQLGVEALTFARRLQRGVPLCRVHAQGALDGMELALKGGQMGSEDFFAVVRDA